MNMRLASEILLKNSLPYEAREVVKARMLEREQRETEQTRTEKNDDTDRR